MKTIDRPANADAVADAAVKAKHRAMWASGDYPALAHDLIADLGPALVDACGVRPRMRVLDVAAGAGNAALVAADAGADVVAGDLTPELFAAGRAAAAERGVEVTWREADAEALPFADAAFDVVMSCVGVMFAPHHQQAADELVRVCRPGGTIGLLNWAPDGFIGQMFALTKPYAAPPPLGAQPRRCGATNGMSPRCSATGSSVPRPAGRASRYRSRPVPSSATTSSSATARPSPCTATSARTPSGHRSSTARSPNSASSTWPRPAPRR
jgi:SAM-dependent methyltransferase